MRTKNSLKNIISVVIFNIIIGVLGFLKVKVFVNGLTDDIYSLNQLFYQIFGYIAIADIGFGLVLNKQLYSAFAKKDKSLINSIYSTSKKFFKYIAFFMMAVSIIISFFVQYLTKADVNSSYIQLVFMIFMIRNIIDYFFVSPRYVMDADQKNYKINHFIKTTKILEILSEIILVYLGVNYLVVLVPGIFITLFMDLYINSIVYKEYPWLKDNGSYDKNHLKGTKDLIYLRLSGLMNSNTDIILISTFINPLTVIIYTSYVYITKFVSDTIHIAAGAITPSYANVLNKESDKKTYDVFKELNILFLFVASFVFIMLYSFLDPLIDMWVGSEYLTDNISLFLFCLISFQAISIRAVVITINSKGLFKETKLATICETILNLLLSITLIFKLGLKGVLLGTVIATFLTSFIQNAVYIYKHVFNEKPYKYFINYFISLSMSIALIYLIKMLHIETTGVLSWIIWVLVMAIIVISVLFLIYYLTFKSFRVLTKRAVEFIKVRGKYTE